MTMTENEAVRCRVAACRESLGDGKSWSFYLINDGDAPLDSAVLNRVSYEWGDEGSSEDADVRVPDLAAGAHALIWRDDGSGAELRMDLSVCVCVSGREVHLLFEFPKLYMKSKLPLVAGLGKAGWQVTATG
jgi:hypothetical protein